MLTHLPSADELLAERCRRDLGRFVLEAWPIVEPAVPYVSAWHIEVVCEHLQAVSEGDLRRLLINVPPRTMKSLAASVFWPAWEWLTSPSVRWLYASYAENFAHRDSLKTRRVIKSQGGRLDGTLMQRVGYQGLLRLLMDDPWELAKDQDAKTKFENTETGMRLATGLRGQATGEGGDRIVVDDPLSASQGRSDADREYANTWWDETMTTRFNNASGTAVIVMQRLHEEDVTGHLLEKGGWHHLCLPMEYEPAHPFVYPDRVKLPSGRELPGDRRTEAGELLDPVRFPASRVEELAVSLGSYGYAGQMQQRPAPSEGGMFKRAWWKRWTPESLPHKWERVVASWDMRFTDHEGSTTSYVVGQVWGINGAERYLLGQIRARLSFTDTVKAVQALHGWRPDARAKLVEKKANGAAVIDALKNKVPGLIPIEPEGGKEVRAAAAEPYVEAGNFYLPASEYIPCPPGYDPTPTEAFIGETAVFPNGAHDDQVDAFTQVSNWLEHKGGEVSTQSYMPTTATPRIRRGDLILEGEHYIDKA